MSEQQPPDQAPEQPDEPTSGSERPRVAWKRDLPVSAAQPPAGPAADEQPRVPEPPVPRRFPLTTNRPRPLPPLPPGGQPSLFPLLRSGLSARPARVPSNRPDPSRWRERTDTPLLDELGRDLTAMAHDGDLRPVVGRDDLILDLARALLRRDKPNPLLIGEPGVGKTALVEGLARRIAAGEVAERLLPLRIVELPVSALVAGTVLRGSLESRVRDLIGEALTQPHLVLFIDEAHLLLGAGETRDSEMDVANLLKPALARGELRCIAATTVRDAEPMLREDPALARRFLPLRIEEMSPEAAKTLMGLVIGDYAAHHGVSISAAVADVVVDLAVRYLPDRRLPDKALDLLDDACARVVLPTLTGGSGTDHEASLTVTPHDVAATLAARRGITVPDWELTAHASNMQQQQQQQPHSASRPSVPLDLAERLGERIVGQPDAIAAVADGARLAAFGLRAPERPRGVLLFVGPTGVGKTALAKALAETLYGSERAFFRLDLSEFGERHMSARLIGAPPGYIGHREGGHLTRFLRQTPQAVILLDEIEKAHDDVLHIFLQLFDAGRLSDGHGETVDARHAYFVLTSNLPLTDDLAAIRRRLKPEFLNRIDRVVPFRALELGDLEEIARRRLVDLKTTLRERRIILIHDDATITCLARPEADGRAANGRTVERRLEQEIMSEVVTLASLLGLVPGGPPLIVTASASSTGCRVQTTAVSR